MQEAAEKTAIDEGERAERPLSAQFAAWFCMLPLQIEGNIPSPDRLEKQMSEMQKKLDSCSTRGARHWLTPLFVHAGGQCLAEGCAASGQQQQCRRGSLPF